MGFFVDDSLFVVTPIVNVFCVSSLFCNIVLSVLSSFAIITMRKRVLDALLCAIAILWLLLFCASTLG